MRVLITGGAGLIGSNLIGPLLDRGDEVLVADNLWRGSIENIGDRVGSRFDRATQFVECDLRDREACRRVTTNVDLVIHLADIVAGIKYVFENELFVFRNNLLINSNVLDAAIENQVSQFLYVGTACSYPQEKQAKVGLPPLIESDAYPADPESGYGWSKLMGEYECGLAHNEGKIQTAILRLHNVYGPPCHLDPERSQVIPALCRKVIEHPNPPIVVWGSGEQRRAFVFVEDVVLAICKALDKGWGEGVIQIGPEESVSIKEVAELIVGISGRYLDLRFDKNMREGDQDRVADNSKALEVLGWAPRVQIETGLEKTYEWVRQHLRKKN